MHPRGSDGPDACHSAVPGQTRTLTLPPVPRRPLVLALVAWVAAAGCGGGRGGDRRSGTTAAPAPATSAVTTTTAPTVWPLTGQPAPAGAPVRRPALVVKIDNGPPARPQSGLNQADVVVEEQVEGGVTRFFSVFHSTDADPVGPVRSARTTDIQLVSAMNRPLFAYAGTNATFQRLVNAAPLVDVGYDAASGDYSRRRDRPAPYNLYSSTAALFRRAPAGAGPPPALFTFRPAGTAADGAAANRLHLEFRNAARITTAVDYAWDGAAGVWRRSQAGAAHVDATGAQVGPRNVVVQFVNYRDTGQRDQANSPVPEAVLVGQGEAWVLSDGKIVRGTWSKPSPSSVTTYSDSQSRPIALTPGQTWVELPLPGSATVG